MDVFVTRVFFRVGSAVERVRVVLIGAHGLRSSQPVGAR
ncbi:hypothetical protein HNR14_001971 [Leifsonia naganoensis]|uniref:Uncharacterized protein n=1 Tax=Leifsonia naganoensis TaxID=150025 RepID=A0A853DV95_9MICO|nr:hypothetical protein [Leifsonia naganoensis]